MLFLYFSLFCLVGASPECTWPGCARISRQVSLLQLQSEKRSASGLDLKEHSSAQELAEEHGGTVARLKQAHATATAKHEALEAMHADLLQVKGDEPEKHPNASVEYHSDASSAYQKLIAENATKCQECAAAEQALIAALQEAHSAHFAAERKARAWALARGAHDAASQTFTDALAAHAATKEQLFSTVITYRSSQQEYEALTSLTQQLSMQAQFAVTAEAWRDANQTLADTAQSEYDTAAAAALVADQMVESKQAQEETNCGGITQVQNTWLASGALPSAGGGSAGTTSYTSPNGWTISSDMPTYNNGNLYWLSNAIDGSDPCQPSTCSERHTGHGPTSNAYWLAARGGCAGSSWLEVKMDEAHYIDHVVLQPWYRLDSTLTHFRVLADDTDVTPAGFDDQLASYFAGTSGEWPPASPVGTACEKKFRVDVKTIVQRIRLAELTQGGDYCGFGEITLVGKM